MSDSKEIIEQKISTLIERTERLKRFKDISFNEFSGNLDTMDIVERNLQIAIEACIDIGKIIISDMNLREPTDNKGVFKVLAEDGIISQESLDFLMPMAGTRNILIHGYDKVDETIIFGILKKHLEDFYKYLSEIKRNYLEKR
ncbi:MAG: type VII toxin-antitoxin system HepT family RNase toxin [Thermodesulfovibrionales bacterium]